MRGSGRAGTAENGSTSFTDSGQLPEQQVCYRVIAFNDFGESAPSGVGCTIPPAAPTNLVATADAGGIVVTWTDNSAVEVNYVVVRNVLVPHWFCPDGDECYIDYYYYDYQPIASLGANTTSYRDSNIGSGESYTYYVYALTERGSSDWSNPATVIAP